MLGNDFETIRYQYKPDRVKMLFVGESRPNGGTFFYHTNSNLYKNTKETFRAYFTDDIFSLDNFKSWGCWLYDICEYPINHLSKAIRTETIRKGMPKLKDIIEQERPKYIVVCKKGKVRDEIQHSEIMTTYQENMNIFFLPFPACGRQKEYREQLVRILEKINFRYL